MMPLILLGLAGIVWVGWFVALLNLQKSDPLGRKIFEPFVHVIALALWLLLVTAILILVRGAGLAAGSMIGLALLLTATFAGGWAAIRVAGDGTAPRWLAFVAVGPALVVGAIATLTAIGRVPAILRVPATQLSIFGLLLTIAAVPWWFVIQNIRRNGAESARMEALRSQKR